ncbi:hypothetical protein ACLEE3_08205 [Lonsdalea quercina]|uniref:hypothetical protein n=1 Tax=Lonsdalea quercina TaxID=71657 RepID=UPI003975CBEA
MTEKYDDAAAQGLRILTEKLRNWRDEPYPAWNSTWPVFERLIERHEEMKPVYVELAERKFNGTRLWILLEQCVFAGGFSTEDRHATLRADHKELLEINENIMVMSIKLAELLERRSEILNRSGHFYIDNMVRLTDFIDEAGKDNGLYRSNIQPQLNLLNHYDLKYWPDMAGLLHALGEDNAEIKYADEATAAIIGAKRSSLTDFFRELFDRLDDIKDGSCFGLPSSFRMSDSALATLSNIIRDLPPDEMIDASYVKRTRQRLKEQGFSAAW